MKKGKELCELLKSIRKKIADANGIKYEPLKCNHEGDCRGTCPMCDSELNQLSEQVRQMEEEGQIVDYNVLTPDEEIALLQIRSGAQIENGEWIFSPLGGIAPAPDNLILDGEEDGKDEIMGCYPPFDIIKDDVKHFYVNGILVNEEEEPVPNRIIKEKDNTAAVSKKDGTFTLILESMPTTVKIDSFGDYEALEYDVKNVDFIKIVLLKKK